MNVYFGLTQVLKPSLMIACAMFALASPAFASFSANKQEWSVEIWSAGLSDGAVSSYGHSREKNGNAESDQLEYFTLQVSGLPREPFFAGGSTTDDRASLTTTFTDDRLSFQSEVFADAEGDTRVFRSWSYARATWAVQFRVDLPQAYTLSFDSDLDCYVECSNRSDFIFSLTRLDGLNEVLWNTPVLPENNGPPVHQFSVEIYLPIGSYSIFSEGNAYADDEGTTRLSGQLGFVLEPVLLPVPEPSRAALLVAGLLAFVAIGQFRGKLQ